MVNHVILPPFLPPKYTGEIISAVQTTCNSYSYDECGNMIQNMSEEQWVIQYRGRTCHAIAEYLHKIGFTVISHENNVVTLLKNKM